MNSIAYITVDKAIAIHDEIISASGGLFGLRDKGLLISTLTMIQNDLYYPDYDEKLTHLIFSINKNHCFVDGNKRSSIALAANFLLKNGWSIESTKFFILKMESVVVWLADNVINKDELIWFIGTLIYKFNNNDLQKQKYSLVLQMSELSKELKFQTLEEIDLIRQLITKSKLAGKNSKVDILDLEERLLSASKRAANLEEKIKFWELYLEVIKINTL